MNADTLFMLDTDTHYFTLDSVTGDLHTTEELRTTEEHTSELTIRVTAYNLFPYECEECMNDTVTVTIVIQVKCVAKIY